LLAALAAGLTARAAGRKVGLSERTVWRRLADADFRARLTALRGDMLARTCGRLSAAGLTAVRTLRALALTADSEAARCSSARAILEFTFRGAELVELEQRIGALEARQEKK
jgi:hypothetical protein